MLGPSSSAPAGSMNPKRWTVATVRWPLRNPSAETKLAPSRSMPLRDADRAAARDRTPQPRNPGRLHRHKSAPVADKILSAPVAAPQTSEARSAPPHFSRATPTQSPVHNGQTRPEGKVWRNVKTSPPHLDTSPDQSAPGPSRTTHSRRSHGFSERRQTPRSRPETTTSAAPRSQNRRAHRDSAGWPCAPESAVPTLFPDLPRAQPLAPLRAKYSAALPKRRRAPVQSATLLETVRWHRRIATSASTAIPD